jgi:hypothetical protein
LHHRCTTLSPRSNANPLCVIANYVVDSLPADAFALVPVQRPAPTSTTSTQSSSGNKDDPCRYLQLQESLLGLSSPRRRYEPDLRDPSLIRRARLAWSQRDVSGALFPMHDAAMAAASTQARPASSSSTTTTANALAASSAPLLNYYSGTDAPFNTLLRDLCMQLAASPEATAGFSLLLPVGFLRCLNSLMRLSHGNLLLLAGDKAHTCAADLAGLRAPHLALHGSFSLMANFLALKSWFLTRGGDAVVTPNAEGFRVGAFATMAWARDNDKEQKHQQQPTGVVASVLSAMRGGGVGVVRARSPSPSSPFEHSFPDHAAAVSSPSVPFAQALPQTGLAFHQSFLTFSPEHFSTLQRCVADLADQAAENQAVASSVAAELSASSPPFAHEALAGPSLRHVQSLLRLAHGDADLFYKFRHVFIEGVAAATAPSPSPSPSPPSGAAAIAGSKQPLLSEKALRDLRMDLSLVGASYYPLVLASVPSSSPASLPSGCCAGADSSVVFGDDDDDDDANALFNIDRNVNGSSASVKDIAFELGRAWMALRCYVPEALACFEASLRDQGEHPVTRFNIGLATYYGAAAAATTVAVTSATTAAAQQQQQQQQQLALLRRSLSEFTQCLAQSPGYTEASEWCQRVEAKIKLLQQQSQSPSQPPQQQQYQLQQPPQPQQPQQIVHAAVHANGVHAPSLHNPSASLPAHLSPSFYAYSSPYL